MQHSILSVSTALPDHRISQEEALAVVRQVHSGREDLQRLVRVFPNSGVKDRYFVYPAKAYLQERDFEERNLDYIEQGLNLAERAAKNCLRKAGVAVGDVDHLLLVTTTGLATPSLDARLVERLGLRSDVRRWPLFGLGCAGGAGGLTRACDILDGSPDGKALVVSVELCGQIFSTKATTPADIIGASLFGDGAAAALVGAGEGPRIGGRKTVLYDGTEHLMGWSFTSDGMRLVLSREVTDFIGARLKPVIEAFLLDRGLTQKDVAHWLLHPGGRRIIETYGKSFGLDADALRWTRSSLERVGNLSSASILFILADAFEAGVPGDRGLMVALGPGFASELLLLEW
ncbi:MAG TPA: 3-oxoacyl-[acyl-carrier-protein] synthase III C-terminal domain-containing protein [Planctomycetota bacterium]|nr:3-oxoacyl-[acyl-carrier-protein] synthase III C-terminal domain-containing protein [Planctomycetota bacterium]